MAKQIIKGFVHYQKYSWEKSVTYPIFPQDMSRDCPDLPLVFEQEFEVEIPDDFNPVPQMVAALEEKKRKARIKMAEELAGIDAQIGKLMCITNDVPEAE